MFRYLIDKKIAIAENFISNMKWYDVNLLKLSSFVIALLVAKYFIFLLKVEWHWYVLLLLVLWPRLFYIAFKKT